MVGELEGTISTPQVGTRGQKKLKGWVNAGKGRSYPFVRSRVSLSFSVGLILVTGNKYPNIVVIRRPFGQFSPKLPLLTVYTGLQWMSYL